MSKTKPSSKGSKSAKPDLLTKVKDAAITKPAQTVKAVSKAASKELTKQVSGKESKKDKKSKKAKEPTPEPSDSESSESSGSDSEEEEASKPVASGKANGVKKAAPKEESSDDSDSDSSESEAEAPKPKANGSSKKVESAKAKAEESSDDSESDSDESMAEAAPAPKAAASDDDDDDSSDESSEDEKPAKKSAAATATKDAAESDSDDDSDSSEDAEEESTAKPNKRKAEDEVDQSAKKSKTEAVDTSKGSNLFVGNLSWNVDEAWLKEVFEEFGELQGVRIVTDRDSGRSKGFGYVEFINAEDAAKAHAAKSGSDLDGRTLNVDFANARPDKSQQQENRRKSYGDSVGEASDTLFLGNLSFEVGQEAVTEAFAAHGTILGVRLPTDRETGQPKGFGYVTFASVEEASAALEGMQGAYIEGRPIRLDYSTPRPQNSDSPARGRGGFGGRGGDRGGRGGRGRGGRGSFGGRGDRGGRGGRGGSTNRGGFGDFSGRKTNFD